jgi:hypothetical protein
MGDAEPEDGTVVRAARRASLPRVAIYWRVGAEHQPDPFRKRTITLASSDELFGEELREYFDSLATVPPAVLQNLGEGVSVEDRLREAGYVDAAAKLERFAAAARAWE